jgi:ribosomal protein L3 glutamine methyltransferase
MAQPHSPADDLITVRDLLRYGVSRFSAAKLTFGHGTSTALDEAAFMILEGLSLPIDDLAPWLEARLTRPEREKVIGLIEARVATRKPAPYLLGRAYIQGIPFRVDERVIVPRSYLGELMMTGGLEQDGLGPVPEPYAVARALDLCTGSGCLAILAAMAYPNATVDAVDLSRDALEVAKLNVADHGMQDRVSLLAGDLFGPVAGRRYDLIVANPPYVAKAEVDAFHRICTQPALLVGLVILEIALEPLDVAVALEGEHVGGERSRNMRSWLMITAQPANSSSASSSAPAFRCRGRWSARRAAGRWRPTSASWRGARGCAGRPTGCRPSAAGRRP